MHRGLLLSLAFFAALALLPGRAQAHAHLVRADLAPNSRLRVSVGTVRFWFDEPLNGSFSRVLILNRQGQQANVDTGVLNPTNNEELDVTVPTLPDGLYSVRWTSASAQDGHVMHGFYLFTVGGPGAVAPPSAPAAIAGSAGSALDTSGVVAALAHWLVLVATALWTGALALETLVLAPARHGAWEDHPTLAGLGSVRARRLIWLGLLATLPASALELGAQAYAAAGDWSGPLSTGVMGDVLRTPYGTYLVVRVALVVLALTALSAMAAPTTHPPGVLTGRLLALLGLAYLLALSLSGHAAAVQHMAITSVALDWLHLVAMAIWVGGMAAIALALVPGCDRRTELLGLLDRFSPAAYLALITAATTGMFNAQVRIDGWETLSGTLYGGLLLCKLALIAAIMALSASHVFVTRPRMRTLALEARGTARLAATLRLEPVLGVLVLLCVALMGQVAPSASAFNATVLQVVNDQGGAVTGGPLTATGTLGSLAVALQINPADVGQIQITATVDDQGRPVTDGQVRIKLTMPADSTLGAAFVETAPSAGGYAGTGDLVQEGLWRADVLVRTRSDPQEYRDVPFVFLASPEPALLSPPSRDPRYGPAPLRLDSPPGAVATLKVQLRAGLLVRYQITMQDMSPQITAALPEARGWYGGVIVPPMAGYMNLAVQVRERGVWQTVRMIVCQVDNSYVMHMLL